uniref:Uncharacterized protein n=1 Tax=Leersia perrieri TaxID=77586 RepID=A0A0D9WRP2_9ORYZ
MENFTDRTRLLAVLLVIVSAVIMSFSVDVCHGAREGGTVARTDQGDLPGYYGRRSTDPYYGRRGEPLDPNRGICYRGNCPGPYRPRPYPYRSTPPTSSSPSSSPPPPLEKGEIPPP